MPKNILLASNQGTGKCLGFNTPILMYDGSIKMVQDVQVNDLLMGPDSQPRRVKSLARGREEMVRVIPVKGDSFICNRSHILSLKTSGWKYRYRLNDEDGNKIVDPTVTGHIVNLSINTVLGLSPIKKHRLKLWKTGVSFQRKGRLPLNPYFLGVWLGDGDSYTQNITSEDPEIIDFCEEYAKFLGIGFQKVLDKGTTYSCNLVNTKNTGRNNVLLTTLRNLDLLRNKHIPLLFKTSSRINRLILLAGIIDSDGYVDPRGNSNRSNNCVEIIQKSNQLAEDILFLARSLGFAAYSKKCIKGCWHKGTYREGVYNRIFISGSGLDQVPTLLPRKKLFPRKQKKDALVTGFSLESLGEGDYYGFEIEGPDRLFLLGDFTVTHNSFLTTDLAIDLVKNDRVNLMIAVPDTKIAIEYRKRFKAAGIDAFILASHESIFGHQKDPPKECSLTDINCPYFAEIQEETKLGISSSQFKEEYCAGCPFKNDCYYPNQYSQVMEEDYNVVIIQHAHFSASEAIFKLLEKGFEIMFTDETFIQNIFKTIKIDQCELDVLEAHYSKTGLEWILRLLKWLKGELPAKGKLEPTRDQLEALHEDMIVWFTWRLPDLIRFYNQHRVVNDMSGIEVVYEIPHTPIRVFTDATPPIELIKHLTGIDDLEIFGADEIIDIKEINPGNHRYQIIDSSNSNKKLADAEYFEGLMTKSCEIIKQDFLFKKSLFTVYKKDMDRVRKFIEDKYPVILPHIDIGLMNKGTNKWAHFDFQIILAGRYRIGKSYYEDTYKYRAVTNYHRMKKGLPLFKNPYPFDVTDNTRISTVWEPVRVQQRVDGKLMVVEFPDILNISPKPGAGPNDDYYWFNLIDKLDIGEMTQCERIRWVPDTPKLVIHAHGRFMKDMEVEPILFEDFLNL